MWSLQSLPRISSFNCLSSSHSAIIADNISTKFKDHKPFFVSNGVWRWPLDLKTLWIMHVMWNLYQIQTLFYDPSFLSYRETDSDKITSWHWHFNGVSGTSSSIIIKCEERMVINLWHSFCPSVMRPCHLDLSSKWHRQLHLSYLCTQFKLSVLELEANMWQTKGHTDGDTRCKWIVVHEA